MSLVELLYSNRIRLEEVDLSQVKPDNIDDPQAVRGRIAETMAEAWLSQCEGVEFDTTFPRKVNGYRLESLSSGIVVVDEDRKYLHEFDFMLRYRSKPTVVEVKALKLRCVQATLPRALSLASEIYETDDISMLLFFPFFTNKQSIVDSIEGEFPQVHCVSLGYKKKQLRAAVSRFYRQFSSSGR